VAGVAGQTRRTTARTTTAGTIVANRAVRSGGRARIASRRERAPYRRATGHSTTAENLVKTPATSASANVAHRRSWMQRSMKAVRKR
jgi:hypothetical protein